MKLSQLCSRISWLEDGHSEQVKQTLKIALSCETIERRMHGCQGGMGVGGMAVGQPCHGHWHNSTRVSQDQSQIIFDQSSKQFVSHDCFLDHHRQKSHQSCSREFEARFYIKVSFAAIVYKGRLFQSEDIHYHNRLLKCNDSWHHQTGSSVLMKL